ncbi:MAG: 30S ribosomal protein S20 [Bacilli bacterium]
MPNVKSAEKRIKVNVKKSELNNSYKSSMKTAIKKMEKDPNKENLNDAIKKIDKAYTKGVIHKNNASRNKARVNALLS